ncbi:FecCD family ABC transporter permease [Permianibacter aggregans]|uniref:Iron complex transport system permease protein n=1 Tax=Permianibacter aggregans TaxID=1510150 RepID=A0A4R6UVE5_9GAMM|nr:iron ABC transporter permease [Permianibacter aggregans]QGX41555.1 iron ABC transporter permease [Permianibacter aggregans]TDQ51358.1 iron complex transport system permease protein [Permianibacter aggregans]
MKIGSLYGALFAVLLLLSVWHLTTGTIPLDWSLLFYNDGNEATLQQIVFHEIRLPRTLLAASVGAVLGISGAAMQGLLRNPLAEPGLLGVSSAAALGAVLSIYYGGTLSHPLVFLSTAIIGAASAVLLMQVLAGRDASTSTVILAGVAVGAVASSGIALALNFAPNPYATAEIVYWLLGSFANRTMDEWWLAMPCMLVGSVLLWSRAPFLRALTLGERTAQSLGFAIGHERLLMVLAIAISVGAAVAVSGAIGFIGLLVPHLMRPLVAHDPGRLLPVSALTGAALMVAIDIAVQVLAPGRELKLGVLTALLGAPFFFYLVIRERRALW